MSKDYFDQRKIPYVCFHYHMDGQEYPDDLGQTMSFEEFYDRIAKGAQPKTSQVNVDQFTGFFLPYLEEGKDILHVSLSSGISGAYNSAVIARRELLKRFPGRRIEIVDSRGASSGYGMLMDMLADKRDAGGSLADTLSWAELNKLNIHHWFFSSDLTSYIRGGRISKAAGLIGTILGICPLLDMDAEGHLIPREKIRSKKKVIQEIVNRMKQHAVGAELYNQKCFISHSACLEDAKTVAQLVEETFPHMNGKVLINSVGTVIGSHTGPGTVALFFIGDQRTNS